MTIRASYTDAEGRLLTGRVFAFVDESELEHIDIDPAAPVTRIPYIEKAIQKAASETGVPPQFLKAQVMRETAFVGDLGRYEGLTIDFKNVSGDVAPQDGRNHPTGGPYYRKHMFESTVLGTNRTPGCVAILGPNAQPVAGCNAPADGNGTSYRLLDAPVRTNASTIVLGREGMPVAGGYRTTSIRVTRFGPTVPGGAPLDQVEQPVWTWRLHHPPPLPNSPPNTPPRPPQLETAAPTLTVDQVSFDYSNNRILLGRALTQGEWIAFRYEYPVLDTVQAGTCTTFDPARFDGRTSPSSLTFVRDETIQQWYSRNFALPRNRAGRFLNGTDSEQRLEFRYDPALAGGNPINGILRPQLVDSRMYGAKAQFLAAGSYGLIHATLIDWTDANKAPILNNVLNLGGSSCIYDLVMTRPMSTASNANRTAAELSVRLGTASHSFYRWNHPRLVPSTGRPVPPACGPGDPAALTCSQEQWLRHWAIMTRGYNWSGDGYKFNHTAAGVRLLPNQAGGVLSEIAVRAIRNFDAK